MRKVGLAFGSPGETMPSGEPDLSLYRQLLLSFRFEGFPDFEAERLAAQMTADLQEHP
jgi:hypothetical protein